MRCLHDQRSFKGITDALYAAFGDNYEIHTEASMQDMAEPAFFVRCINPDMPRGLTGRRKATLLFIVQYFPESDEPKKEINTVYERLSECLDLIEVEGKMVRGTIECKDISDDVMSATAEYTLFLGQSQKDAYMEECEVKGEANSGRKQLIKLLIPKEQIIGSKKICGAGRISCRHYWNRGKILYA